ncbi:undecaprenyldiphospho-muramoylpentapeptide beta-N-acetylglucosaminyltransferase [Salsipaludibacter albus]|uniref:undecaprenyldiphospho-muramoylpentapeptide beta-N-acetylglucosaminyltransferase n=1 Tax=Salsipaludibacter albus TaxID=2849650 RepID=UPI001EE4BB0A|nr:undecaprenyldiphospho-muramoylpentapeptide beta-N-acetylglucosaminyltransferase [Salsipaludibacter albus]MBY5163216.1 undecaprenyldiphospho-muramoylpentapeptide beta-N-acetylglucosaminyltransferase [Salsipaludibacter albus]
MTRTVLFAGGGTAGHVFPALAVARELVTTGDWDPVFVGTRGRLEERLVPEAGFEFHLVDALPLPRRPSVGLLRLPGSLRRSRGQVSELLARRDVVAAATFGGYVSFPVSWAAGRADIPLLLHEQNAVPGLANQFAARWADRIAVTFPSSTARFGKRSRTLVTGNPVRDEILALDRDAVRAAARRRFELDVERPTVLVFGGSQGARSINRAIAKSAREWGDLDLQIIHAAGTKLHEEAIDMWRAEVGDDPDHGPTVRILDFIDDMSLAYAAADVVVCRAGATSISELTVLGLPAVLVPYPAATRDHQTANARALAATGAAVTVEDGRLSGRTIVDALAPWIRDPAARAEASLRARAFGRREAARLVADAVRGMVEGVDLTPGSAPPDAPGDALALPETDEAALDEAFAESARARTEQIGAVVASWEETDRTWVDPAAPVDPDDEDR